MHDLNWFLAIIVILVCLGIMDDDTDYTNQTFKIKTVEVKQKTPEKKPLFDYIWPDGKKRVAYVGDVHKVKFEINLVYSGYVGSGPATEIIRTTDTFSYPNKYLTGNNGLITNAGINEYHIQLTSIFGEKYNCYIATRKMLDRAIIRNSEGKGQPYLAQVKWQDDNTLLAVLDLTTDYELQKLDKKLFGIKI